MILFFVPDWLTGFNFLIALFSLLVILGGALVVLLVKGRGEVTGIQLDRATSAEALVKTRDAELIAIAQERDDAEEELEALTAEHRTLVGIDIAKLMEFWAQKEDIEAKMRDLERDLRIERRRRDGDKS